MSKKLGILVALLLVALLAAACGGGGSETEPSSTSSSSSSGGSQSIEVSGTDFAFSPADLTVKRGSSVEIVFKNDGRVRHDLVIEELGVDSGKVNAGQSSTFSFTPNSSGEYKIVCTEPGHEASGMVATLTVE